MSVTILDTDVSATMQAVLAYAQYHPSRAGQIDVQNDLPGFVTDLLVGLQKLCAQQNISFSRCTFAAMDAFDAERKSNAETLVMSNGTILPQ